MEYSTLGTNITATLATTLAGAEEVITGTMGLAVNQGVLEWKEGSFKRGPDAALALVSPPESFTEFAKLLGTGLQFVDGDPATPSEDFQDWVIDLDKVDANANGTADILEVAPDAPKPPSLAIRKGVDGLILPSPARRAAPTIWSKIHPSPVGRGAKFNPRPWTPPQRNSK